MKYEISLTESAKKDIAFFEASDQRVIVAGIIAHLKNDNTTLQPPSRARRKSKSQRNPRAARG